MAAAARDGSPWLLDPSVTFLNHGSFGACPAPVLAAQAELRERLERGPVAFLARELEGLLDGARHEVAAFLGADPEGLAFVPNATTGVATVLASLRFRPGDELVASDHEYNATLNALRAAASRDGAKVVLARIPFPIEEPDAILDAYRAVVGRRTRLVLVSQVTSPTALVVPVAALVREVATAGVDVLVDGAHAPGMLPVGLEALGAAYWTGNCHKWLCAPKGAAVLHVRADRRDRIRPLVVSHGANDDRPGRSRFRLEFDWTGTADPTAVLAVPAAIRFGATLHRDGWPGVMAANRALALAGRDAVADALGIAAPAPDDLVGSMASIPLPAVAPTPAATAALQAALLAEDRIEVPVLPFPVRAALPEGGGAAVALLRLSAQRYNAAEDYRRLGEALARRLGPGALPSR